MRLSAVIRAIEKRLGATVHPSARGENDVFSLHRRLITLRILSGLSVFALLPAYLVGAGGVNELGLAGAIGWAACWISAAVLSATGRLVLAQALASFGFVAAVCALAHGSGGPASPILLALVFVPVEAQLSRRTLAVAIAGGLSSLALVLVWLMHAGWLAGQAASPLASANSGIVAMALAFAVPATLVSMRRRSRVSQERRHLMAQARLMLENVGDIVALIDARGRLSHANEAARRILNLAPEALRGQGLIERVLVADRPLFLKAIDDAAQGTRPVVVSFRATANRMVDGEEGAPDVRWLEMRAHRIETERGMDEGGVSVVAVLRDETDRRAAEEERERARAEAQRASELKGRFLATVSHELRTPLNAIIGFSEMLADETLVPRDSTQARDYARIIHTSGHHLLEVVNALLDISKIESGAMTVDHDALDVARMVGECCDLMANRCQAKGVALERVIAPDLPLIMGDKRALKQVTINLLSNALKFTPEGGRITVALVRDKGEVDLSVSDTGIGIAAEDLPRLGLPFFQAKSSYDRSHEGTGLGLSVVRGLVGLHGGSMSIESAVGEGTRVCVRLPVEIVAPVSGEIARIATFSKTPRRQLGVKEPLRLSA